MTDQPASLAEALARLQTQLPRIGKDKTATVTSQRTGKTHRYDYANLATVSEQILPLLGKLGLSFTCTPTIISRNFSAYPAADEVPAPQPGTFVLEYVLRHTSGHERVVGYYPLPASGTPQDIGSAITYARRYCLCAVTGAAPDDDDDDGAAASQSAAGKRQPPRPKDQLPRNTDGTISRSQTTDAEKHAAGIMTDAAQKTHNKLERDVLGTDSHGKVRQPQGERLDETPPDDLWLDQPPPAVRAPRAAGSPAGVIHAHFKRLGFTDDERPQRLKVMSQLTGRVITSTNDLKAADGVTVMRFLEGCKNKATLIERLVELQQEAADAS